MLQQIVTYYPELKSRLNLCGDPLVVRLYGRVILSIRVGQRERLESYARELQSYLWECLHSVHWKDTHTAYRDAFGTAALAVALCEMERSENFTATNYAECIKTVDIGLLLGSEFMRPQLQELATTLQKTAGLRNSSSASGSSSQASNQKKKRERDPASASKNPSAAFVSIPVQMPVGPGPYSLRSSVARVHAPSLSDFYRDYFLTSRAVVITGCVDHWPALNSPHSWSSLFYLKTVAGSRTVPVELGPHYLSESAGQRLMSLTDFIDGYICCGEVEHGDGDQQAKGTNAPNKRASPRGHPRADGAADESDLSDSDKEVAQSPVSATTGGRVMGYLAQHQLFDQIAELRADFDVPDYCALLAPDEANSDVVINAWLGPQGTVSPLHHDPFNNLLVQVVGHKLVRIYSPACSAGLYPMAGKMRNNSGVDLLDYDAARFPLFAGMPYSEAILGPGDALFIPRWTWHFIQAVDAPSAKIRNKDLAGGDAAQSAVVAGDAATTAAKAKAPVQKKKKISPTDAEEPPHCFSISFWWGDRREKD